MVFLLPKVNSEEIIAVYKVAVLTNTKKTSKLAWQYLQIQFQLLLLDVRLSVYGEKRQKTKLVCLPMVLRWRASRTEAPLQKLYIWLTSNKLSHIIKKSNFVMFRPHQKQIYPFNQKYVYLTMRRI